jgi:hypothetical protein
MQREAATIGDPLGHFLGGQAAALSAGAAAIHFAVIGEHVTEYWLFGAFFFVLAWFQTATAIGLVVHPHRRLLVGVAMVNVVVIAIWFWSRTAGLPIGPEAGEPEAVGAPDVLSTVFEALLVGWVLALLQRSIASRRASRHIGILATAIVWAGVAATTAVVFFTSSDAAMPH